MKKCCRCKEEKSVGEFYKDRSSPDGISTRCKVCHKANAKRQHKNGIRDAARKGDTVKKLALKCKHCGNITRAVWLAVAEFEKMKDKFSCNYCLSIAGDDSLIYGANTSKRILEIRPSELPYVSS